MIISVITTFGVILSSRTVLADITVDSYCQLTIQTMQQETNNLQSLVNLYNQYKNDPNEFIRQEAIKKAEFEQARNALYTSFGTTADEYALYMGEHSQEVNEFLKSNANIKQQIDSLSSQIKELLSQYESLKGHQTKPPSPLPLPKKSAE